MLFNDHISKSNKAACTSKIDYEVVSNEIMYWESLRRVIDEKANIKPVIVFLENKSKVSRVAKMCKEKGIVCDQATNDIELENVRSVIRQKDRGVVLTLGSYGRGVDLRFKVDSLVVIGYAPANLDCVIQMTGRSSRTMGTHESLVLIHDKTGNTAAVQERLASANACQLKDGIRVAHTIQGKHLLGDDNDETLVTVFKAGWKIEFKRLATKLGQIKAINYEKAGSKVRPSEYRDHPEPVFNVDDIMLPTE